MSGEDVVDIWNGCTFLPRLSKEPVMRWVEIEFGQASDHDIFILVFILLCSTVLIIDFLEKLIDFLAEINTGEQLDVLVDDFLTGRSAKVKYTFVSNLSIFSNFASKLST